MRIAILTSPHHVHANLVLNSLVVARGAQVVAVYESTRLLPGRSSVGALAQYLSVSGPTYVAAQAIKQFTFRIARAAYHLGGGRDPVHPLADWRRAARANGTVVESVSDINDPAFLARLESLKPDVLLSALFNQILRTPALKIARHSYNLHPAPLPHGRGVSPTFWLLARGEREAGVTWHEMTPRVDVGTIAAQETFDASGFRTEHALYREAVKRGSRLLGTLLDAIDRGERPSQPPRTDLASSYDSLPTRAAYAQLRRRGNGLFTVGELVGLD